MADLAQHAVEHGALLLLDRAADLSQTERAQRATVPLALADLRADLRDAHLRHQDSSFFLRMPRFGFASGATASGAGGSSAAGSGSATGSCASSAAGSGSTTGSCAGGSSAAGSGSATGS